MKRQKKNIAVKLNSFVMNKRCLTLHSKEEKREKFKENFSYR